MRNNQTVCQSLSCEPSLACHCRARKKDTITCKFYKIQISVSINKVLLVHSNICLCIIYGCFFTTTAKLNSCDGDYNIAHEA